jgi:hypothetical protein
MTHFSYLCLVFFAPKVAGLDLNERKGSSLRYIPPHLRGGESSNDSSAKQDDTNQGENFRDFNNRGAAGGEQREFNNR